VSQFFKRWWWALLVVAVGTGLIRLRFDVDILNLLPADEPTVQGLRLYERHFADARELVISVRAPDVDRAEHLAGTLAARLQQETNLVAGVSWQPPWEEDPSKLGELLGWLWFNQPPELFDSLTNKLADAQLKSVLEHTKELLTTSMSPMDVARATFDPFDLLSVPALTNLSGFSTEQNMFASGGGSFRVLYVQAAVDLDSYRSCEKWLRSIQAAVAGLRNSQDKEEWENVVIRYTGRPVFLTEIASSMQHDMGESVVGTSGIIAVLFWLTHRRWLPMLWLLALLGLILLSTLALGGLILGTISVVSMGFAAVLLGLAVDYAVVHYQEALAHPNLSVPEIRRAIARSILWAAITTISAFLVLNLGGLPGLGQLGTLVAIGVALSALVMVMIYLPPLFPQRRKPTAPLPPAPWWSYFMPAERSVHAAATDEEPGLSDKTGAQVPRGALQPEGRAPNTFSDRLLPLFATGLVILVAGIIVCVRRPTLDRSSGALRPQHGAAETALDEIKVEMKLPPDPLWLIVSGPHETEVYHRLTVAESLLKQATSNHIIGSYLLPRALWPQTEFQMANRSTAALLGRRSPLLQDAALSEGFNTNALGLTEGVLQLWARAGASTQVVWPTNGLSQWLLKRFVSRTQDSLLVMGLIYPPTSNVPASALADLSNQLAEGNALLSGWELLGAKTLKSVQAKLWQIVTPMVTLVLASLWFAFRRPTEILLGAAVLLLSGLVLTATMAAAGWSWNLLNLMGLPLILGTGVDYSIFMQLALRRHGGRIGMVRRSIGRALLLCGGTAMAGFGSLAWSSNPGMASLGKVCAVGIAANMLISVFLLPAWWITATPKSTAGKPQQDSSARPAPSSFYRAGLWRVGLVVVRILPVKLMKGICILVSEAYFLIQRKRREVVVQNLLPAFAGERPAAKAAAHRLHRKFASKLVDLWRAESGAPVCNWLTEPQGIEIIKNGLQRGSGVLFITLHLGNWEHGGLLLNQFGIRLTVLSQAEPEDGLTDLRTEMRKRCGVETLIIGQDSFAFVEVIKRLQNGAALAIAMDRPPTRNPVSVELFGQPFAAPAAAAELARASGCALIGVTIVRRPTGYAVKVLPEFTYDRKALGSREARRDLTQQILRAFEPLIRQDIDQWYQFVPIWPN
jgi:predicted RND superfamily exporter protein/predicted LPLAT superfamily acyltransferase